MVSSLGDTINKGQAKLNNSAVNFNKRSKKTITPKEKNISENIELYKVKSNTSKNDVKGNKKAKSSSRKIIKDNENKLTNYNQYLFHQGKNYKAYDILGIHFISENKKRGVQFVTWAPNASEVYVVGDFNNFEINRKYKLKRVTDEGLWKGFFTAPKEGDKYKYCIVSTDGIKGEYKADPYAVQSELRPGNASIVYKSKSFRWSDKKWINKRNKSRYLKEPVNIYEVHLGSWRRNADNEFLTYEELSEQLPEYLRKMGYTHVEIMPLAEHPLDESWGYQGTGFFSPTSRYGNLEGLKTLINKLHKLNIGVIMDWVPGHFCKDAHGLYKFDGLPLYEYQEEWRAENKGWGTCNFDLGRCEVKSFLISNALYWFREFHVDGLRVDSVSSILYLDYNRQEGEWVPNKYGDNGSLEAIDFLKQLNKAVFTEFPSALMIAEESTSWPNVTKPVNNDGLGFNLKWNMGWMNDTLDYITLDPLYRKDHHRNITFSMMYNYSENFLLPLSHDEIVHEKKPLIEKMWGDEWNKFAGMRNFISYMIGHPGKKLTFMGCEFAQNIEWREYEELKWDLIEKNSFNKKMQSFFKDINNFYLDNRALWELDYDESGFEWIEPNNADQSILIFARKSKDKNDTLIFVINFCPVVYYDYQIGVPYLGEYEEIFNSDDSRYGGSGQIMDDILVSEKTPYHNQSYSLKMKVPPMATSVLRVKKIEKDKPLKIIE